ncbi:MAG: hypothetical protein F6K50_24310 [Moorea sp. SIO3I7]|nr:hypothetical protein [Moorena sp. SIO3I7]NEO05907.1 hypothetical protein [Moorena sp. SIO3I8]NEO18456.1 hypothetical protein [Moorena sp. SIO4A5]NEP25440.1 hypothetical protein [Moorena sp. SIO3I6]NEQ58517.1 hypothetical protein [Moorena sp. SIO4A1]
MPTALRVALVVGSVLFVINHGSALLKGQMNRERWISGGLTYIVPYLLTLVNHDHSHVKTLLLVQWPAN